MNVGLSGVYATKLRQVTRSTLELLEWCSVTCNVHMHAHGYIYTAKCKELLAGRSKE